MCVKDGLSASARLDEFKNARLYSGITINVDSIGYTFFQLKGKKCIKYIL